MQDYTIVIPIVCEDDLLHTDEHPFCDALECPCKSDVDLYVEYVYTPVQAGLITEAEAERIYLGRQLNAEVRSAPKEVTQ